MTATSRASALLAVLLTAAPAQAAYQTTTTAAGPDNPGAAPTQPPLFVAGVDPSGNIKPFTLTAAGLALFSDPAAELSLSQIKTVLGSPFQAGGSIGNTGFAINGTLPAFAATPTVNLGTLGGAATDASVQQIKTVLGTPMQAGGSIGNTGFNALQNGQANSATNQFFEQTVGPSMQAPGTAATIARAVQRPDGKPLMTSGDKVGIDQTTPGTTNKVSLGSDVVATYVPETTNAETITNPTLTAQTQYTLPANPNRVGICIEVIGGPAEFSETGATLNGVSSAGANAGGTHTFNIANNTGSDYCVPPPVPKGTMTLYPQSAYTVHFVERNR